MNGTPCPLRKHVTSRRGPALCPDCRLEATRRRRREDVDRLQRIEKASPPVDAHEDLAGPERDDGPEDDVGELEVPPPAPPRPRREKAGHRQPAPKAKTKVGATPWWATADRDGFTKQAEGKVEEMEASPVAKTVPGQINKDVS